MTGKNKTDWFTIEKIDENTSVISEYKHWEETHCYVLNGTQRCLLISSTDPIAYMNSIKKLLPLPVKKILPAHHRPDVPLSIIRDMDKVFTDLYNEGKLKHGSGTFSYDNFGWYKTLKT